jgi:hypothetical protein
MMATFIFEINQLATVVSTLDFQGQKIAVNEKTQAVLQPL